MNTDRFKFRAWCEKFKVYAPINGSFLIPGEPYNIAFAPVHISADGRLYEVNNYDGKEVCQVEDVTEYFIIEQCTGLRDKNCNLIYEGDVVRVEDDDGVCNRAERIDTGIGTVEWVDEMWYIAGDIRHGLFEIDCTRNIEIIGNVHEMEVAK